MGHASLRRIMRMLASVALFILANRPASSAAPRCTITDLDLADDSSLAVAEDGSVYVWGYGGDLGIGSTTGIVTRPIRSLFPGGMVAVAAGEVHGVALDVTGAAWAWGRGDWGQLGNGTWTFQVLSPVPVVGLVSATAISAGVGNHTLALDSTGTVRSWGDNQDGQLGDGTNTRSNVPVQVLGLSGVTAISAGQHHSLAMPADGSVWAWGNNISAQLGDGTFNDSNVPVRTSGMSNVVSVAAGSAHSLALRSDGTVWAWGDNSAGQLGDGSGLGRRLPVRVMNLSTVAKIASGWGHSLAIRADGTLWAWGADWAGQLGDGPPKFDMWWPVEVPGLSDVRLAAGGSWHTVAVTGDGSVWAWGQNIFGQLGDGTTTNTMSPVRVDLAYTPPEQGNVLLAAKVGRDALLQFDGALALLWRIYADLDPAARGTTGLSPELTERLYLDIGAIDRPDTQYYYLRGLSLCSSNPGP